MDQLKAIILDDEVHGRETLQELLYAYCPEIKLGAAVPSLEEARAAIDLHSPDIIFMDVCLGNQYGFELIPFLPHPVPYVIVTSAHEQYAIRAIRANAQDYLLKPLVRNELKAAVQKVIAKKAWQCVNGQSLMLHSSKERKIAIPSSEGMVFVSLSDIIRCEASGAYTYLFFRSGERMLTSTNLGEFEKLLSIAYGFLRIHHSSIINLAEVKMYMKADGGSVLMSDRSVVQIAQRKRAQFLDVMRKHISC
jgi:two-component system, LytTR family, response regulator